MRRIVERFNRTPVVWRLAVTSAGLTFAILLSFALVVGFLAESRIKDDFDNDLRARTGDLQESVRLRQTAIGPRLVASENTVKLARSGGAAFRVVSPPRGATVQFRCSGHRVHPIWARPPRTPTTYAAGGW